MAALALTILLAVLWLGFVALGYWHGGWRQIVVLAAMLLSYAVLSEWAAPNGHDLATQFHWSIARATTAVGLLYLLGGTLVLGLLGSFALERPYPLTVRERQCGAAMGVLNGGLLLALVLRTLRSYAYGAAGGKSLRTAALSRFLIERTGYLLLAALAVGVVAVGVGLMLARRRIPDVFPVSDPMPTQAIAIPPPAQQTEAQPVNVAPTAPRQAPSRPSAAAPIYAAEPIIDWPTTPPPGTHIDAAPTVQPVPAIPRPAATSEAADPQRTVVLPEAPSLPRRIEPPMRYPVAALVAASATPVRETAALPSAPPPRVAQPTTPPPGALHPIFAPPTVARPPQPPMEPTPAPDSTSPVVPEIDIPAQDAPPVVRELDVMTQDVPTIAPMSDAPLQVAALATEGETMDTPSAPAAPTTPMGPPAVTETAPFPTVIPPPLPPMPPRAATTSSTGPTPPQDEAAKPRAGFARVAVARQPGQRVEQPSTPQSAPQSPTEPDPLQPPLPTGPRIHACPTCGYPVRDHARYCPNCGSRQRP